MKLKTNEGRKSWLVTELEKLWIEARGGQVTRWQVLPIIDQRLEQIASETKDPEATRLIRKFINLAPPNYHTWSNDEWRKFISELRAIDPGMKAHYEILVSLKIALYEGRELNSTIKCSTDGLEGFFRNSEDGILMAKDVNTYHLHRLDKPTGFVELLEKMEECIPSIKSPRFDCLKAMAWYHQTRNFRPEDRAILMQSENREIRLLAVDVLARKHIAGQKAAR